MGASQLKSNFIDAEKLGRSLKEVSVDFIQSEKHELRNYWYHSANDIDLYFWKDEEGTIIKQQLCFMGLIAEWNIVDGVKTGTVNDDSGKRKSPASPTVDYHKNPKNFVLNQAQQISAYFYALTDEDRTQCQANWKIAASDFVRHKLKALIGGKKS